MANKEIQENLETVLKKVLPINDNNKKPSKEGIFLPNVSINGSTVHIHINSKEENKP